MPFTASERSICNKIVFDFDLLIAPIKAGKGAIRNSATQLEGLLNTTSFASEAQINGAIDDFEQDVDDNLPDTSELEEIVNMISNCAYLSDFASTAIIANTIASAVNKIDELASNVGSTFPEFNMGRLVSSINDLLFGNIPGSDVIKSLFQKADKLINCLSAYCGGEYPSQVSSFTTTMNDLYSDMNIISDPIDPNYGNFDINSLYSGAGIIAADRAKVNSVISSVDASKATALSKIDSVFSALKTY